MDERILKELSKEKMSPFHEALLQHVKELVDGSRKKMATYYKEWDRRDRVYQGKVELDSNDKEAQKKGDPEKMVIPMTYSQIQTFVAFCFNLYYQREYFFELEGTGEEDHRAAKLGEALLERYLEYNTVTAILYQLRLDVGRFSIGVVKAGWHKKTRKEWQVKEQNSVVQMLNRTIGRMTQTEEEVDVTEYLGNKIVNISPYRFFPDTRLPLTR